MHLAYFYVKGFLHPEVITWCSLENNGKNYHKKRHTSLADVPLSLSRVTERSLIFLRDGR